MSKPRVVLGMSGGVDSSVAAYVLLEQGYEVIGVTMQIWPDQGPDAKTREGGCCSLSAVDDARRVADHLGIPYYVMNFKAVFEEKVINYFVKEYQAGRTPNPCIACNRYVKFQELLRRAKALEAAYVATGHYARIEYDGQLHRWLLKKSASESKDQTYALYNITQDQLAHTLMPLGAYDKDQVRAIARQIGLRVAGKPDSQEICFVEDNDYGSFIEARVPGSARPGWFIDARGRRLGQHPGVIHFTVGQRKGLGIALGKPMYVTEIRPDTGEVVLGDAESVFSDSLTLEDINLIAMDDLPGSLQAQIKIRYTAKPVKGTIVPLPKGRVRIDFDEPVRAVTPGQAAVFYDGDLVLGGGTITYPLKNITVKI